MKLRLLVLSLAAALVMPAAASAQHRRPAPAAQRDWTRVVVATQKEKTPDEKTTLFSMLALQARAASRAGQRDEARAAATEALAIERKPQPMDPALLAEIERIAKGARGD